MALLVLLLVLLLLALTFLPQYHVLTPNMLKLFTISAAAALASAASPTAFGDDTVMVSGGPLPAPKFAFAKAVGSGMVLQSAPKQAMVWGFCPSSSCTVAVGFGGKTIKATIGPDQATGKLTTWRALLPATAAGFETHIITATSAGVYVLLVVLALLLVVLAAAGGAGAAAAAAGAAAARCCCR